MGKGLQSLQNLIPEDKYDGRHSSTISMGAIFGFGPTMSISPDTTFRLNRSGFGHISPVPDWEIGINFSMRIGHGSASKAARQRPTETTRRVFTEPTSTPGPTALPGRTKTTATKAADRSPPAIRSDIASDAASSDRSPVDVEDTSVDLSLISKPITLPEIKVKAGYLAHIGNISFARGSSNIKPGTFSNLDRVVAFLVKHKKKHGNIVIESYTRETKHAKRNQALSQRRADAILIYLSNNGVDRMRLKAVGLGSVPTHSYNSDTDDTKEMDDQIKIRVE